MKSFTLGRLVITTTNQPAGAPLIDEARTVETSTGDRPRRVWVSFAILLRPWRRNRYGESLGGRALVIGWERRTIFGAAPAPEEAR